MLFEDLQAIVNKNIQGFVYKKTKREKIRAIDYFHTEKILVSTFPSQRFVPIERNEWNRLLTDDEVVLGGRRRFETVHGIIRPVVHVRSDQEQENGRNVQRIEPPEELHDELWTERQIDRAREKETERQTERERERERETDGQRGTTTSCLCEFQSVFERLCGGTDCT